MIMGSKHLTPLEVLDISPTSRKPQRASPSKLMPLQAKMDQKSSYIKIL
jgi:hypothetical protein